VVETACCTAAQLESAGGWKIVFVYLCVGCMVVDDDPSVKQKKEEINNHEEGPDDY
jgi:hypothetical protein